LPVRQLDTEAQAAGNDRDLLGLDVQDAELGRQAKPPQLGNDQELAILRGPLSQIHYQIRFDN
jgi:hypothetical protein